MRVLGISAFYHDSAAAVVEDGVIVAAAQEERFTRVKHDASFPTRAVEYCLARAGGGPDAIVYYEKPLLKFERILRTAFAVAPRGFRAFSAAMPVWLRQKLWIPLEIERALAAAGYEARNRIHFAQHHESHAAGAFYPSPFQRAAVLTIDGVGEWSTATLGLGHGTTLELLSELRFPHSLGLLYSAFTYHCGFRVNSGEYKLMGLAPYGIEGGERVERYRRVILDQMVDLRPDGSLLLNMDYFDYATGLTMCNAERFERGGNEGGQSLFLLSEHDECRVSDGFVFLIVTVYLFGSEDTSERDRENVTACRPFRQQADAVNVSVPGGHQRLSCVM
jgi:carbamoyltransferase